MTDHPFRIGDFYANRIGQYEVLAVDDATGYMIIRYDDSGKEAKVSIEIQMRILDGLRWEKKAPIQRDVPKKFNYFKGFGESFTGLNDIDFKLSTKGTHWRSRQGLAGKVALLLSVGSPYSFISWSIYRWPVSFITHREEYNMTKFDKGIKKAKFIIELDEVSAYFGFYVEQNTGPMDHTWDWPRLIKALNKDPELPSLISDIENKFSVLFLARYSTGGKRFHFSNGKAMGAVALWDLDQPASISVEKRIVLLDSIPKHHWGEIYILRALPKAEAISAGESVADEMADLMRTLIPLYRAAVTAT